MLYSISSLYNNSDKLSSFADYTYGTEWDSENLNDLPWAQIRDWNVRCVVSILWFTSLNFVASEFKLSFFLFLVETSKKGMLQEYLRPNFSYNILKF